MKTWAKSIGLLCGILGALAAGARAQEPDLKLARQYFEEAQALCAGDNGRLWGASLCGPMLFVEPRTRFVAANQPDPEGHLSAKDGVFFGQLPQKLDVANTATDWAGVRWSMIVWPLPKDSSPRAQLMMHESWHRVQDALGLPASNPANTHLDLLEGRIWLRLEWRALRAALTGMDAQQRREAMRDALLFRAERRRRFTAAATEERALEMNEGLAEYTGMKLADHSETDFERDAAKKIDAAESESSFVRSFAYVSGPAYGFLLDQTGVEWRRGLSPEKDLGDLLVSAGSLALPQDLERAAGKRAARYDGAALRAAEIERELGHRRLLAEYRRRLVDGPVLVIPLRKMNVQFDPHTLVPLDNLGTVYPSIRVSDEWGVLTVTKSALLAPDWSRITVAAPSAAEARPVRGDGWTLELQPGWRVEPSERMGDFKLESTGSGP